ncbi:MAG: SUMF1/EgtB/PvdO family nonheme iron enzyme, partial [Nitrospinaceae bacterium]|nr:SUMF1/EgtB/PvdO family nonheme iron enzyme [Nitrospinaceae bacterium]
VVDWENSYSEQPETNPKGPASGINKIMRGGSWYAHPNYSSSTYRGQNSPTIRYTDIGFRCVLAPQ